MNRNRFFKFFSIVLVLLLTVLFSIFPSARLSVTDFSRDVISFFDRALALPFNLIEKKAEELKELSDVYTENRDLKKSIFQESIDSSRLSRLESENQELKELLNVDATLHNKTKITATILNRTYSSWNREFLLNKGKSEGVKDSMYAVTGDGVIGIVTDVSDHSSSVELLVGDLLSKNLTFKIEGDSGSVFALLSRYDRESNEFVLTQLGDLVEIKTGALVSTSGLGNYSSPDLPLGVVASVKKDQNQLGQEIRVKPKALLNNERYVMLIGE